ncbi:hypothetical protein SPF06_03470 [Sinomonas sp. JGH33]|uniref:Uncharacterized protein n=1 Tax=Sinomonas terricola TaxID=3110330 RepID=A0ABU5T2A9_9MICC|nr:hypothetical protein [Sinomonas sp. JGH33]MEA5453773.1 hypothetical protein [Sinomonas sp. JGH33]
MKVLQRLGAIRAGRRATTAAAAVVLLVASASAGFAYWLMAGTGSGAAAAGQLQALTAQALVQPAPGQQLLFPGGTADAVLSVTNPNPYDVQLYSVAAAGPAAPDAGHPQCTTTGVTFQNPAAPLTPNVTIPANSTATVILPGTVTMDLGSDSGCQGAVFHLPLTLEVRK